MEPLISVIIPVYNVEQYLEKCVNSVIEQTYKNLEIILINDGSTDNSGKLCDELALKDPRISVYHKQNGGLSSARNLGIDKSKGTYIGFIDSDDYIDLDMYELLYSNMKKYNADISMCGLYNIYANTRDYQEEIIQHYLLDAEESIKTVLDSKITSVTAVNKLYTKSLFNDLRYELGRTSEDAFIIVKLLDKCKKISITNERKYYYFHRNNSITKKPFSKKTLDVIDAYQQNLDIVSEKYPNIIDSAKRRLFWSYFYVLDSLFMSNQYQNQKKLADKLIQELQKNMLFILKSPYFTKKRKVLLLFLILSKNLYAKTIIRFKNKINS